MSDAVSHHIDNEGRFQSDRHPELAPDKIVLSFRDPAAQSALRHFATMTKDRELAEDIHTRLDSIIDATSRHGGDET